MRTRKPTATSAIDVPRFNRNDPIRRYERIALALLGTKLSRRQLLRGSLAVAGSLPMFGALARSVSRFEVIDAPGELSIVSDGVTLWQVDTEAFEGAPLLAVQRGPGELNVQLTGAFYPGLDVAADLHCRIFQCSFGWTIRIAMAQFGFEAEAPFDLWLLGNAPLHAVARAPSTILKPPFEGTISANDTRMSFHPDWTIELRAEDLVRVTGPGVDVRSDLLQIELPPLDRPRLVQSDYKRSHLWLEPSSRRPGRFVVDWLQVPMGGEQCSVVLETTRAGIALQAWTEEPSALTTFHIGSSAFLDPVAVSGELYAASANIVSDAMAVRSSLSATAAIDPQWIRLGNAYAEISGTSPRSTLRSVTPNAEATTNGPSLVLSRFVVPFPGVDRAIFVRRGAEANSSTGSSLLQPHDPLRLFDHHVDLDQYDLDVARSDDALRIKIRFRNIDLHFRGLKWRLLERRDPALLEYDFGPQHTQEESAYETDESWITDPVIAFAAQEKDFLDEGLQNADWNAFRDAEIETKIESLQNKYKPVYARVKRRLLQREPVAYPARSRTAGPTRLTFALKSTGQGAAELDLDFGSLFAWMGADGRATEKSRVRFVPRLAPTASQDPIKIKKHGDLKAAYERNRPRSLAEAHSAEDGVDATAIEAPYRVTLSPIRPVSWAGGRTWSRSPRRSRFELWNTVASDVDFRAIYSPDFLPGSFYLPPDPYASNKPHSINDPSSYRTSLDPRDRHEFVALSGGFAVPAKLGTRHVVPTDELSMRDPRATRQERRQGCGDDICAGSGSDGWFLPQPIRSEKLLLTSLGATFKHHGAWDPPSAPANQRPHGWPNVGALSVTRWDHLAHIGRDSKVVVEYLCYLMPLTIPVVLVKETQRKFDIDARGRVVAGLRQRFFIRGTHFVRVFTTPAGHPAGQPYQSRDWPHQAIEAPDFVTPNLEKPEDGQVAGLGIRAFWPRIKNAQGVVDDVLFEYSDPSTGAQFFAPMICLDNTVAHTPDMLLQVICAYREKVVERMAALDDQSGRCIATIGSGKYSFVVQSGRTETEFAADRYILDLHIPQIEEAPRRWAQSNFPDPTGKCPDDYCNLARYLCMSTAMEREKQPPFYPRVEAVRVTPTQLARISPSNQRPYWLRFDGLYQASGFDPASNAGEVFGRFYKQGPTLAFASNTRASGGMSNPGGAVAWWSRKRGSICGPQSEIDVPALNARNPIIVHAASTSPTFPHSGGFDPKQYFKEMLGDAKLLGVVRLADILDVVLAAAGTKMPTLEEEELFDFAADALRPIVAQIKDWLADPELTRLLGPESKLPDTIRKVLSTAVDEIRTHVVALQAELEKSPPGTAVLLARTTAIGRTVKRAVDDIEAIAANPKVLLPPDVLKIFNLVEKAVAAYDDLAKPDFVNKLVARASGVVLEQLTAEVEALLREMKNGPELQELERQARTLRDALVATRDAIDAKAADLLREFDRLAEAILATQGELAGWLAWLDRAVVVQCKATAAVVSAYAGPAVEHFRQLSNNQAHDIATRCVSALAELDAFAKVVENAQQNRPDPRLQQIAQGIAQAKLGLGTTQHQADRLRDLASKLGGLSAESLCQALATSTESTAREYLGVVKEFLGFGLSALQDFAQQASALVRLVDELQLPLKSHLRPAAAHAVVYPQDAFKTELESSLRSACEFVTSVCATPKIKQSLDDAIVQAKNANLPRSIIDVLEQCSNLLSEFKEGTCGDDPIGRYRALVERLVPMQRVTALFGGYVVPASSVFDAIARLRANLERSLSDLVVPLMAPIHQAVTFLTQGVDSLVSWLGSEVATTWLSPTLIARVKEYQAGLATLPKVPPADLDAALSYLREVRLKVMVSGEDKIRELARAIESGDVAEIVNVKEITAQLLAMVGLPTTVRLRYSWDTTIRSYPEGSAAIFIPGDSRKLKITAVLEADLLGKRSPSIQVDGSLDRFEVSLFGGAPFMRLLFEPLTFKSSASGTKFDVRLEKVVFGQQLNFVQKLQEWLSPKDGLYVQPSSRGLEVGYRFAKDLLVFGGFTVQNISFSIAALLPFDNGPARFLFKLADARQPFLVSAGIYGGGGYVGICSRVDQLEYLEASFEYGLVTAFEFGPAKGSGRITAGVYIRLGGQNAFISGFFNASGAADIAGLITVSACFRITITYRNRGVSGSGTFEVGFSIGILDYTFSVPVGYSKDGDQEDKGSGAQERVETRRLALAAAQPGSDVPSQTASAENKPRDARDPDIAALLEPDVWRRYWSAFAGAPRTCLMEEG